MDARRQKAEELATRARITFTKGFYLVPSQSHGGCYRVNFAAQPATCTCPDFELTGRACKHVMAVSLFLLWQAEGIDQDRADGDPSPRPKRPTYPQRWAEYNAAQTNERRHFMDLLADLTRTIPDAPKKPGRGRPPILLADAVYSAVFKVYSTLSARRFAGDLEEARKRGLIDCLPHFNSVLNCLDNAAVTPILTEMVRQTALPLAQVETSFAPDSSGFCTSKFTRWFDVKYGVTRQEAEWVKVHIMTGVKTNIVTAIVIQDKHAADVLQFPALIEATARGFKIKEVTADKAFCSADSYDLVDGQGGTLYSPFKSNATGAVGGTFEKMFHYFCLRREEFLAKYHQRSNVESTFSMVKRKFGDAVRSKSGTAMMNEVLAKFVCHNLCCLISAWYELGIEPIFGDEADEPRAILRMPRRL